MSSAPAAAAESVRSATSSRKNPTRWLYAIFASVLVVITLLGFQQFYLHGRAYPAHPFPPPVKTILITHGVFMTAWIVLFLLQPLLIASGNRQTHIRLGTIGAFLAAGMLVLGLYTPIATTRAEPDVVIWGLNRLHFTAIPIFAILTFAGFVALGVWYRNRPVIHRPMMLFATIMIIAAAADRITGLPDLYAPTVWGRWFGPFFVPVLLGAAFVVVKAALTRGFDRWSVGAFVALTAISAAVMRIAPTHTWERVATWLVK